MKDLYTWKILDAEENIAYLNQIYKIEGGGNDLKEWKPLLQNLKIDVSFALNDIQIADYINVNTEDAKWVLFWRCDHKFTGSSALVNFNNTNERNISVTVPKGYAQQHLEVILYLISIPQPDATFTRPPGSILAERIIIEEKIGDSPFLPIEEYDGDGTNLIQWQFFDDDLTNTLAFSVRARVDRKHPLYAMVDENPQVSYAIMLMLIQSYVRKALTPSVLEQLLETNEWEPGSLGYSYHYILNQVCDSLNGISITNLKDKYQADPYSIESVVCKMITPIIEDGLSKIKTTKKNNRNEVAAA